MKASSVDQRPAGTGSPRSLFFPALILSGFATQPANNVNMLLLVDIGLTFAVPVGVAGRIMSAAAFVQIIVALAMGALSLRFQHKHLLLAVFVCVSPLVLPV